MARKPVNKANLATLGAETLAELLLDAIKGDAARQRRVRMALNTDQGSDDLASEIRKRFATIRRANGYLSTKSLRSLTRELSEIVTRIDDHMAADAPETAFDLLWALLHLAPGLYARTNDNHGALADVLDEGMAALARLAPRVARDRVALAETIFDALQDNFYGEFDGIIGCMADALGREGLTHLKARAEAAQAPVVETAEDDDDYLDSPTRRSVLARQGHDRTLAMILRDVADASGDVDGWLARYTPEQLTFHTIAPEAAQRLLAAERAEDALRIVTTALSRDARADWLDTPDLDDAHFACLAALGREDGLRAALWARFEKRLCPEALRRHLHRLPDFDDIDAEDQARDHVRQFPSVDSALAFCLSWPDLTLATEIVIARSTEIDGEAYEILTPLADALEPQNPLAAVLVWRAMISFALDHARSGRYGHAARHLAACARLNAFVTDYSDHPDHHTWLGALRRDHARKSGFWRRVP